MLVRRRAWLAAVIPAITMAVATCDDEARPRADENDSGPPPGVLGGGVCPESAPDAGEACVAPEGTTCSFNQCGSAIAQCTLGTWRYGGNPPTFAICPTLFPSAGDPCPCFATAVQCVLGSADCTAPDASPNQSVARCPNGVWVVETVPCGGPRDAGADVQGDAAPDSD